MSAPRIMFARTGGIGNALASVPALRALRHARPEAHITVVVDPASNEALLNCPYANELLVYDKGGADTGTLGWLRLLAELRKRRFTHAILSKRFLRMSLLARLAGAKVRVGFDGYGFAITHPVKWEPRKSVIKTNLDLLAALDIQPHGLELEIWPSEDDKIKAENFLQKHNLSDHKFIVAIHPGGISQRECLWPASNYAEIAARIENEYGAAPLFIGGPPDAEVLAAVKNAAGDRFPICTDLTIRGTAHLISKARMFIGSDSAPSHLANAVGTPSVVYYGPKDDYEENFARWFPLSGKVIAAKPLEDGSHPDMDEMMGYISKMFESDLI